MKISTLIFCFALFACNGINAQKEKKWDAAINSLEKEKFVLEYLRIKDLIESDIKEFKKEVNNGTVTNADLELVVSSYKDTKESFDQILDMMKFGFTIKSKRKELEKNPAAFTIAFESHLENSFRSYQDNCQKKMHAMSSSFDGAFGLSEITLVLGLVKELYGIISSNMDKTKKMSGEYFENHFVSKLRLKEWDAY